MLEYIDKHEAKLQKMNEAADKIIRNWSFGALLANLLPPPFDSIAVASAFAKMGQEISKAYEVQVTWEKLKQLGKSMFKGIGAVAAASYIGTGLFKYIPGVNVVVALLIQPPIVGMISYTVGQGYKKYFISLIKGKELSAEEIKRSVEAEFKREMDKKLKK